MSSVPPRLPIGPSRRSRCGSRRLPWPRAPRAPSRSRFPTRSSSRSTGRASTAGPTDDHAAAFATFLTSCRPFARTAVRRPRPSRPRSAERCETSAARRCGAFAPTRRRRAQVLRGQFPAAAHRQARRSRRAFSPAITSRSSKARACRPANSTRRFIAARPISSSPAGASSATPFPTKRVKVGRRDGQKQDRALLRPRRDRGRRARWPAS